MHFDIEFRISGSANRSRTRRMQQTHPRSDVGATQKRKSHLAHFTYANANLFSSLQFASKHNLLLSVMKASAEQKNRRIGTNAHAFANCAVNNFISRFRANFATVRLNVNARDSPRLRLSLQTMNRPKYASLSYLFSSAIGSSRKVTVSENEFGDYFTCYATDVSGAGLLLLQEPFAGQARQMLLQRRLGERAQWAPARAVRCGQHWVRMFLQRKRSKGAMNERKLLK